MDKRERILQLKKETSDLENEVARQERNCDHKYGEAVYDPIVTPDMVFSHYEGHGSDPYPVMENNGTKESPRWKQTCPKCGKSEYTTKTKTIAPPKTAPDFG